MIDMEYWVKKFTSYTQAVEFLNEHVYEIDPKYWGSSKYEKFLASHNIFPKLSELSKDETIAMEWFTAIYYNQPSLFHKIPKDLLNTITNMALHNATEDMIPDMKRWYNNALKELGITETDGELPQSIKTYTQAIQYLEKNRNKIDPDYQGSNNFEAYLVSQNIFPTKEELLRDEYVAYEWFTAIYYNQPELLSQIPKDTVTLITKIAFNFAASDEDQLELFQTYYKNRTGKDY